MTPFSQYKGWLGEGGIRNALIVSGPAVQRPKGSLNHGLMHVADIMPTLLERRVAPIPKGRQGEGGVPAGLLGTSWKGARGPGGISPDQRGLPGLGTLRQPRDPAGGVEASLGVQAFGNGGLGVVQPGCRSSRAEGPRSKEHPEKVQEMIALWDHYVMANNVILPNRSVFEAMEEPIPPRVPDNAGYPPMIYKRQFVPPKELVAGPRLEVYRPEND